MHWLYDSCNRYLIWIGSDQEKTFGPTISGLIHRNLGPERVTLWDSKQRGLFLFKLFLIEYPSTIDYQGGRPDVMKLIKEVYRVWGAEVVFITSNFQGNKEMMEGCKEAGIPAFVSCTFIIFGAHLTSTHRELFGIFEFYSVLYFLSPH